MCGALGYAYTIVEPGECVIPRYETPTHDPFKNSPFRTFSPLVTNQLVSN